MDRDRYLKAAHAMQTGVALEMSRHAAPTEPKHLRVGVNAAMSDQAGLVKLLIAKGIFTEDEYFGLPQLPCRGKMPEIILSGILFRSNNVLPMGDDPGTGSVRA